MSHCVSGVYRTGSPLHTYGLCLVCAKGHDRQHSAVIDWGMCNVSVCIFLLLGVWCAMMICCAAAGRGQGRIAFGIDQGAGVCCTGFLICHTLPAGSTPISLRMWQQVLTVHRFHNLSIESVGEGAGCSWHVASHI